MAIFAVMGLGDTTTALADKIRAQFPEDHYVLSSDKWFVSATGLTAAAVALKLGMTKTENILGVVVTISGYNGLASADIWEWLKVKGSEAGA